MGAGIREKMWQLIAEEKKRAWSEKLYSMDP